jgi:DNA-binding XRE family transcriptional regulator
MTEKKQLARHLYLTSYKTQKQIAEEVGVSERTIYSWIHDYAWNKLKVATYTAPATICDNLCSQLVELQDHIATREPGKRFPTPEEAEVTRKMVLCIATMKKTPSLSMHMQVIESFKDFARPFNKQFSRQLSHYAGRYLSKQSKNGFAPFQMEYGIDPLAAVSPFYDELDGETPCDTANPPEYPRECKVKGECKLTTGCSWPKCEKDMPTIKFDDPIDQQIAPDPWPIFEECHGERSRTTTLPLSSSGSSWWDQSTPDVENSTETLTSEEFQSLPTTPPQPEKTGNFPEIPEVDPTPSISYIDCHGERSRTTAIPQEPKKYKDPDYPFDPMDPTPWLPKPRQSSGNSSW